MAEVNYGNMLLWLKPSGNDIFVKIAFMLEPMQPLHKYGLSVYYANGYHNVFYIPNNDLEPVKKLVVKRLDLLNTQQSEYSFI